MSSTPDRPLQDRVALITGATGALGRVVAARLAADGAIVAIVGRDAARLRDVAGELDLSDDRWIPVTGDLDGNGAAAMAGAVIERFGRIDIVVHLVGGYAGGTDIAETEPAELTTMLDQHVWTTFHLARAVAPALAASGTGRFVAISSAFAYNPPGNNAAYAAAKAAQQSLVLSLSKELAGTGATANTIVVRTIDVAHEREATPSKANARWTTPEEIASLIAWLSSDDATQVTGAMLPMYGGPPPG